MSSSHSVFQAEFNFSTYEVRGDPPSIMPASWIWCPLSQPGSLSSKPRVVSTAQTLHVFVYQCGTCLAQIYGLNYIAQWKTSSQTPPITTLGLLQITVGHKPDGCENPRASELVLCLVYPI